MRGSGRPDPQPHLGHQETELFESFFIARESGFGIVPFVGTAHRSPNRIEIGGCRRVSHGDLR